MNIYSGANLSVATDKLIVISGVARYIQDMRWGNGSLRYYAGHWSHNFELQLTWSASYFRSGRRSQILVMGIVRWRSFISTWLSVHAMGNAYSYRYPSCLGLFWCVLIGFHSHARSSVQGCPNLFDIQRK